MKSLIDCFMELIAYTAYFLKTVDRKQPPFEHVKTDILRLITKSEEWLKEEDLSQEDYSTARFAVCAWIDEAILNCSWNEKARWQKEQLQRLYYNTADAGEEFFERLNNLGIHQREVREIYYLCLSMGFMGRYCREGDQYLLDQLKTSNLKLLTGSSVGLPSLTRTELFPAAYPVESDDYSPQKQNHIFSPFIFACLGGPVILFAVLFLIYRFVLSGLGKNILSLIP